METQLIIANIYAAARHLNRDHGAHQLSITPRRDRWHVALVTTTPVTHEGGTLNEALLGLLTALLLRAFPSDME